MAELPSRADGELMVAAVRIVEHTEKHPPTEGEIAHLLRWHEDRTRVIAHGLEEAGVLAAIRSPFDVRYKLADAAKLEGLPVDDSVEGSIAQEMADFDERSQQSQEEIERMFGTMKGAGQRQSEPPPKLAEDFGEFRKQKPKNPFGDD